VKRLREAVNYLCEYNIEKGYGYKFALEAKPNEPRADIYMSTTGHYLGLFQPSIIHKWWASIPRLRMKPWPD
jgi:xylose isomerase